MAEWLVFVGVVVFLFGCITYGLSVLIPVVTESTAKGATADPKQRDIRAEETQERKQ